MDALLRESLIIAVQREQFSNLLKIKLLDLDTGYALVEMAYEPAAMNNIYERAHGGAIFSLIDEAFRSRARHTAQ